MDKDKTTLIDGAGKVSAIEGRIKQIRAQIEDTTSDYGTGKAPGAAGQAGRRRGRHQGGGDRDRDEGEEGSGRTRSMRRGRPSRRGSCRAGEWPGGGDRRPTTLEGDEKGRHDRPASPGGPLRQIVENAGLEGSVIVNRVKAHGAGPRVRRRGHGLRGHGEGRHHRPHEGPVALQNAASIAALLLCTTEALISDEPDKANAAVMHPGDM